MAAAVYLPTEEQLLCCICLDVFTDPVTLPCGHNFCKNCITQHFNFNSQRQCPMCKERVYRKCKLGVNTFISEMAVQYIQSAGRKDRKTSEQQVTKPGEVSCDVHTGTKWTALKSCLLLAFGLACLTICFAMTLKLHQTASSLITHQLLKTLENVTCPQHGKPLELHCKNGQMALCRSCADSSHRFHHIVPLKGEYEVRKKELRNIEAEIQQKFQERQLKIQDVKHWVRVSKEAADREMVDGVQVFNALIQLLRRAQAEFTGMIEAKQKTTEKQVEGSPESWNRKSLS